MICLWFGGLSVSIGEAGLIGTHKDTAQLDGLAETSKRGRSGEKRGGDETFQRIPRLLDC
jgi:hypothetical protein